MISLNLKIFLNNQINAKNKDKKKDLRNIMKSQEENIFYLIKIMKDIRDIQKTLSEEDNTGGGLALAKYLKELEKLYNKFTDFMDQIKNALTRIYNKQISIMTYLEKEENKLDKIEDIYNYLKKIEDQLSKIEQRLK